MVGTAFGRITNLSLAAGIERNRRGDGSEAVLSARNWSKCESATVGVAVQLPRGACRMSRTAQDWPTHPNARWRLCLEA